MDNSLFQFQSLRWDSVIYPQEHFAYIRPSCWCCSLAQKDILNFFILHRKHSHPHRASVWCRPCFDGELARNCWAVPALLGMMAGGRYTPFRDSRGYFVAEGTRRRWVCSQQPLSHSCREPCGSQQPRLGCHWHYPTCPLALEARCSGPRESSALLLFPAMEEGAA